MYYRKYKAIQEKTEKMSDQQAKVSGTPARGKGGGGVKRAAEPVGSSAAYGGGTSGRTNRGVFPRTSTPATVTGEAARGIVIPGPPEGKQAGPAMSSGANGKGIVAPSSAVGGPTRGMGEVSSAAAASSALGGSGAAFSQAGDERGVLAMMDDQV